ncbi:hypothetical protein DPEC_G00182130, partial [Dallia pectoralis]
EDFPLRRRRASVRRKCSECHLNREVYTGLLVRTASLNSAYIGVDSPVYAQIAWIRSCGSSSGSKSFSLSFLNRFSTSFAQLTALVQAVLKCSSDGRYCVFTLLYIWSVQPSYMSSTEFGTMSKGILGFGPWRRKSTFRKFGE